MGLRKCNGWPFRDLDPRSWLWHRLAKICLSVRTTHRITSKHSSFIALVMVITWSDVGEGLLNTFILTNFFKNFGCVFSRSNTILAISQEWLVRLMWNEKEVHWLDTGHNMWPWPLTSLMTLTLDVSRSNFEIALSHGISGLIDVKWKRSELIWYWANCMTCPLTTPMTLTLELKFQGKSLK